MTVAVLCNNSLGDCDPRWGLRRRHGKTRLCIGGEKKSTHICLLSWTNVFRAGCNTLFWETVDGQKIAPLRKCFCCEMLYQCFAILAFQIGHPEQRNPPSPRFQCCGPCWAGPFCLVRFVFVHSLLITRASSNIKSGGERGGSVCHFDVCVVAFFILVVQYFVLQPLRSYGFCNLLTMCH